MQWGGLLSSCRVRTSHCGGFSRGARALGTGAQQLPHPGCSSMWDLPGPGIEPTSPASTGGFLTTGSLGKSHWPWGIFKANHRRIRWSTSPCWTFLSPALMRRSDPAAGTSGLQEAEWWWGGSQKGLWKCSAQQWQWCVEVLLQESYRWSHGSGRGFMHGAL